MVLIDTITRSASKSDLKWLREQLSQGEPSQTKVSKTEQTKFFKHKLVLLNSLCRLTLLFRTYEQKGRQEIAEISVGEKTTKLRPNQTIQTKQTVETL